MIMKTSNGRELIVTNKFIVKKELSNYLVPRIILLTAWSIISSEGKFWEPLIEYFLKKGAKYFVCIGVYSETLHDEIDEIIYQYDDKHGNGISSGIVTTYHDDSIEDAVDYSVYAAPLDTSNECIVAILDETEVRDHHLQEFLKKA